MKEGGIASLAASRIVVSVAQAFGRDLPAAKQKADIHVGLIMRSEWRRSPNSGGKGRLHCAA